MFPSSGSGGGAVAPDSRLLNSTDGAEAPLLLGNAARILRPASITMSLLRSQFLVSLTSQNNRGMTIMGMIKCVMAAR